MIKGLILLGEGIAWLGDFLTVDEAEAGKLVRALPNWWPKRQTLGTTYFVYAGRQYALPKVESFIQTALEVFGGTGEQGWLRFLRQISARDKWICLGGC
jgi:DNA-binding transcriptional LysR family regulator